MSFVACEHHISFTCLLPWIKMSGLQRIVYLGLFSKFLPSPSRHYLAVDYSTVNFSHIRWGYVTGPLHDSPSAGDITWIIWINKWYRSWSCNNGTKLTQTMCLYLMVSTVVEITPKLSYNIHCTNTACFFLQQNQLSPSTIQHEQSNKALHRQQNHIFIQIHYMT